MDVIVKLGQYDVKEDDVDVWRVVMEAVEALKDFKVGDVEVEVKRDS